MSDVTLEFEGVWKKFKKGEIFDSLRDLIPALAQGMFSRARNLELREREFWAVEDLNFQVRRGEAFGIIGANGAGKSTTLKLLSRVLTANRGRIITRGRLSALIEVGAGFHPDLTGRENVYLNGAILGMGRREIARKFDEIVEFANLAAFIDTPVKRYSSGMYARLGFAVAAHVEPEILVVDEVLSVGDMPFQEKCFERMRQVIRDGTTVVFVSHNLQALQMLCSRALLLSHGRTVTTGPAREVVAAYVRSTQAGGPEQGSGPVGECALSDAAGRAREEFQPGERARLQVSLEASVPLAECILSFIVQRTTDGQILCDYNLRLNTLPPAASGVRTRLWISFDVNLLRGAYAVLLNLYHTPTASFLARQVHAGIFTVIEVSSYDGIAHLNPEFGAAGATSAIASGPEVETWRN